MKYDVYSAMGMFYRISATGETRLYSSLRKKWFACYASAQAVRENGSLVAKNVVFK